MRAGAPRSDFKLQVGILVCNCHYAIVNLECSWLSRCPRMIQHKIDDYAAHDLNYCRFIIPMSYASYKPLKAFQELLYLELSLRYDREESREERREGRVEDCLSKVCGCYLVSGFCSSSFIGHILRLEIICCINKWTIHHQKKIRISLDLVTEFMGSAWVICLLNGHIDSSDCVEYRVN